MIRKLLLLFIALPLFCVGQTEVQEYHGDINYKDIMEIKDLIYFRTDTTLVSGKVIRYDRKNEVKSYILVTNGKPDKLGWKNVVKSNYIPPFKPIFKSNSHTGENQLAPYDEATRKRINRTNELVLEVKKNKSEINEKTYGDKHLKSKVSNADGEKDGLWKEYFDNGKLMIIGNYIEGKKDGIWKEYFENGQLSSKSNYAHGKKENLLELYHPKGHLKGKINYKDGKEDGIIEVYHENGQLMINGNNRNGKQIGEWKYYDENGELIKTENFGN